ncbi:MAG TPA: hypothetical protein VKA15_14445 [Isosphaeraceae bacterium]|nr:hypothetical protein [Isosphaeraceae bacterium]
MEVPQLIEALSAPSAYPHPAETVEVHQTHISIVFLAGPLAYKIKKPVDLGFVSYRTLERRRHFCEEEVRLNRRLAPEIYLGVVAVTRQDGAIRMDGTGEVVEWAVKMKRLPDAATLRAHLARGDVGVEAFEELACRLARFHAAADSGDKVAAGGSLEAIARNARENFEQSAPQVGAERRRIREPFHLDRPFDNLAGAVHPDRLALPGHGDDPEIDLRCQATVQADLFLAEMAATLQRAVIHKAQVDGFLDLVGQRPRQEDNRDMRLKHLHRLDRQGIGRRGGEGLDQLPMFHRGSTLCGLERISDLEPVQ